MTEHEYEIKILELQKKVSSLETDNNILQMKLDYARDCFDSLQQGLRDVIDATETAKQGVT